MCIKNETSPSRARFIFYLIEGQLKSNLMCFLITNPVPKTFIHIQMNPIKETIIPNCLFTGFI